MAMARNTKFHIAMYPWFAFGHLGHKITFILPEKTQSQLQHLNLHPTLITFHPLTIPHVDGLPPGAETASDVPFFSQHLLATCLEARIFSIYYSAACASAVAHHPPPGRQVSKDSTLTTDVPPPGYPSLTVVLRPHEAWMVQFLFAPFGEGVNLYQRLTTGMKGCNAISIRTCQEIEGPFCDYIGSQCGKPVLLTGPVLPKPLPTPLEDQWAQWLGGFKPGSVIFCAFGSQNVPEKDQFQELLLGLELTGLPFLVALKPPTGAATVEEALPEGFQERVGGRGVVHGGWVPQPSVLSHPSVGCFSLTSDPQIVLVPELPDQILNTRLLAEVLKVAMEIEKEENGWFSKESLCRAITSVMDEESEVGGLVRKNHTKWKKTLTGLAQTPRVVLGTDPFRGNFDSQMHRILLNQA
ncbi:hypothetical protein PVL29_025317 [Vitis rotundifolia]|uniref:Uncharacterized protein n=1 Tax=Vitis rotundifolia TaxID=103349 RepID=A0AA38YJG2_VITRO|nr:hypothetical protein PVL29_025317 [Vitis rotundifolia]